MKQLVVLSGKGGVGKTVISAALTHLAVSSSVRRRTVIVDADVDAANLELVLSPQLIERVAFQGGQIAEIDQALCSGCGLCQEVCRLDAIHRMGEIDGVFIIDPIACDGCAACMYQCPSQAIVMTDQIVGEWYRSDSPYGPLFHAELRPAQENSGKLVTLVRQRARQLAVTGQYDLILVDGPPGIGCPVIAAASGCDLALIVVEPTVSGVYDMHRILQTTDYFAIKSIVCLNKADLNPRKAATIEHICKNIGVPIIGRIPYDESVTDAIVLGKPVTAYRPDSPASLEMVRIWNNLVTILTETHEFAQKGISTSGFIAAEDINKLVNTEN